MPATETLAEAPPRCRWCGTDPLYVDYHDREWGVPEHDDKRLFELITLEGAQAGLSWITVLRKREHYRESFEGFDPERVARFTESDVARLLGNPGIIRHRGKIASTVANAGHVLRLQDEFGSLDHFLWSFVDDRQLLNHWTGMSDVPAKTELSDRLSKALHKRGFRFVGSTICYSLMQAAGMVNDHFITCHRHPDFAGRA